MSNPGFLAASELTTVQGSLQLSHAAARSFLAMRDDAAEQDHVNIEIVPPGGGYRSMALTLAMRANPRAYNVTPGILPSLNSLHMQGIAADIGQGLSWAKEDGHKYGWSFPLRGDPNHAVYDGKTIPAGAGSLIGSEQDMKVLSDGKKHVRMTDLGYQFLSNQAAVEEERICGPRTVLSSYEFKRALTRADARVTALMALLAGSGSGGTIPADLATKTDVDAAARDVIDAIPTTFKADTTL